MRRLHSGAGEQSLEATFHIQTPVKTHRHGHGILGGLFDHTLNKTCFNALPLHVSYSHSLADDRRPTNYVVATIKRTIIKHITAALPEI